MKEFRVQKSNPLKGSVKIDGAKNAVLPIIAGTLLAGKGKSVLHNVPDLTDVHNICGLLNHLGAKTEYKNNTLTVDATEITTTEAPYELVSKMRASFLVMGPLLTRFKNTSISMPGGCAIGARPIDLHLKAFEKLGITITQNYGNITCNSEKIIGNKIDLDFPSVGATENAILTSVLAEGKTTITNSAREPEIIDLQNFLNKMGAKIKGAGTDEIEIEGVKKLKEISYNIMPDRIETGTFLCLAAITGGKIKLEKTNPNHVTPVINKLEEAGCKIEIEKGIIKIESPKKLKAIDIKTMPYPGFPTDMQSLMATTFTIAKGTTIIVENIFENRYKYTQELNKMGAKITVEGKSAIIRGTRKLYGATTRATDLRGGAALVLAGLVAKGTTVVENIEYILRGYEDFDKKIRALGGDIEISRVI